MDDNMLGNIPLKERSVNFTKAEMDRLQTLLLKYKNILFCKKTDSISSKQKESAWDKIHVDFNALADTPRTAKQLKYKFENLKRTAKKTCVYRELAKNGMRRTGGGPPPTPPPGLGDTTDWLRDIIPSSIYGNKAIYDDDVINQKPPAKKLDSMIIEVVEDYNMTEQSHLQNKIIDTEITTADVSEASETKEKWHFDPSTPYSSLKRPISSPLKRRANKRRSADNVNGNMVRQLLREKKLSVMDNLQELELQKINETIRHAQELHEQTLRHNDERHKLEMEKLQLEIKILKNSS